MRTLTNKSRSKETFGSIRYGMTCTWRALLIVTMITILTGKLRGTPLRTYANGTLLLIDPRPYGRSIG